LSEFGEMKFKEQ